MQDPTLDRLPPVSPADASRLADVAVAVLAALPAVMVLSTRSAPVVLALFTIVAFAARLGAGQGRKMATKALRLLMTPLAALTGCGLALMAASLWWTPDPAFAGEYLAQLVGNAVLIALAVMVAPAVDRRKAGTALAAGLVAATALIVFEFMTRGGIMSLFGQAYPGPYRLNRVVVTTVVLLPLAAAFTVRDRGWSIPAALTIAIGVMAALSSSGAGVMGFGVGLLSLAVAAIAPRVMVWAFGLGAVALCVAMPILAPHVNDVIPPSLHAAMASASSEVRGEIWRIYAALGQDNPMWGYGLESSRFIVHTGVAAGLSPEAVELLSYGHPHNAPLQVWFEFGFVGALIAAGMMFIATRRMDRMPEDLKPYAATSFAVIFAIACVSHGAWQAWWISLIGAVLVWWRIRLTALAEAAP